MRAPYAVPSSSPTSPFRFLNPPLNFAGSRREQRHHRPVAATPGQVDRRAESTRLRRDDGTVGELGRGRSRGKEGGKGNVDRHKAESELADCFPSLRYNRHGKIILEQWSGYDNPHYIFRLFSQSKPITAAATLICVDDELFSLEDPIVKFIPEFRVRFSSYGSRRGAPEAPSLPLALPPSILPSLTSSLLSPSIPPPYPDLAGHRQRHTGRGH